MNDATPATLELRDIHLPDPISWWPLAPGWWFLFGAVVIIILAIFLFRHYQKTQGLKRQALTEFKNICAQYKNDNSSILLVQSLSILLRRTCISFYPRSEVASLTGQSWLAFLDNTGKEKNFGTENGKLLASAPYLSANTHLDINTEKLISLCENWLRAQPNKDHSSTGSRL